jgi:uracil-DNA glycosylase
MVHEEFAKKLVGSWYRLLRPILLSDYFYKLLKTLDNEYLSKEIYPDKKNVFKAFQLTNYEDLKVFIIGQDPYPNNRATGLAFSNSLESNGLSPSLRKIKERVELDFNQTNPLDKDLTLWAKQGIFLYNTILTVEKGKPGSHYKLWREFTKQLLIKLSEYNSGIVYCLWGKHAQEYKQYINTNSNYILEAEHPSYAARQGRIWDFDFKEIDKIIKNNYDIDIKWL